MDAQQSALLMEHRRAHRINIDPPSSHVANLIDALYEAMVTVSGAYESVVQLVSNMEPDMAKLRESQTKPQPGHRTPESTIDSSFWVQPSSYMPRQVFKPSSSLPNVMPANDDDNDGDDNSPLKRTITDYNRRCETSRHTQQSQDTARTSVAVQSAAHDASQTASAIETTSQIEKDATVFSRSDVIDATSSDHTQAKDQEQAGEQVPVQTQTRARDAGPPNTSAHTAPGLTLPTVPDSTVYKPSALSERFLRSSIEAAYIIRIEKYGETSLPMPECRGYGEFKRRLNDLLRKEQKEVRAQCFAEMEECMEGLVDVLVVMEVVSDVQGWSPGGAQT